jgi:hypothetical protein
VYSYLVVYDPSGDPLTIVAVLHGARNVADSANWAETDIGAFDRS